jgi:hypothetical protein
MKISSIRTYEEAIAILKSTERDGSITYDNNGKIIPLSANAKHIFERARQLAPKGRAPDLATIDPRLAAASSKVFNSVDLTPKRRRTA